jgi:hypothetical protein
MGTGFVAETAEDAIDPAPMVVMNDDLQELGLPYLREDLVQFLSSALP